MDDPTKICMNCGDQFIEKDPSKPRDYCYKPACGGKHMVSVRKAKTKTEVPAKTKPEVKPEVKTQKDPWSIKVKIKVPRTNDKTEPREVDVAVQGRTCRFLRGHEVEVPLPVLRALENAVETKYELVEVTHMGQTIMEYRPYKQQRIPVQIISMGE